MKSIKSNLIITMILMIVVSFIILNSASYYLITKNYEEQIQENHHTLATTLSNNVTSFITTSYKVTEEIANNNDVISFDGKRQEDVLINSINRNSDFELFFIQGTDGMQTARSSGNLGDRSERWWFNQIMENKKPFVSKAYYSMTGNIPVTSVFIPIYDKSSQLKGIMGSDIRLDTLQVMIEKVKTQDGIYAYIIDSEGVVIAHPEKEQVDEQYNYKTLKKNVLIRDENGEVVTENSGKPKTELKNIIVPDELQRITQACLVGEEGFLKYKGENGDEIVSYYTPINLPGETQNWGIITVERKADAYSFVTNVIKDNIIAALILVLIASLIALLISKKIADPLVNLSQIIERLAKFDLTFDENSEAIKYLDRKDEIGTITRSLGTMQKNFIGLIKNISDTSQQVASSSEELTATSQQSSTASEEVAKTIEEMARGASEQARNTEDGAVNINALGKLIEKDQKYVRDLNDSTKEVDKFKDEGFEILKDLTNKTEQSNEAAKEVSEIIINTNESAGRIENASQMIKNIAEQTNLLALNAAIEAARAGESGRGFSVVAEEIRKLAEQSNQFTEEIASIIKDLTDKTGYAVKKMGEVGKVVESQTKSVEMTNAKFVGIDNAIEKMKDVIKNINNSGQEMEGKKEEIIGIIENLSAISEENAAGTEEASASIEEQTSSMEEIANASEALARLAEEMQESILRFKI